MPGFQIDDFDPNVQTEFPRPQSFDAVLEIMADPGDNKPAPTLKKFTSKKGVEFTVIEYWLKVVSTATGQSEVASSSHPGQMVPITGMKIRDSIFLRGGDKEMNDRSIKRFNDATGLNAANFQTDPNANGSDDPIGCTISSWIGTRFTAHLAPDENGYMKVKRMISKAN